MQAVSPRFPGKGDDSMMRAIPNAFLSMQMGWIPRLDQVYNPHDYCKTTLINLYI